MLLYLLPAMSSERFLAVVMGLSRRRSSGLLLRSLTFCLSLERSFRLGSEATRRMETDMTDWFIQSLTAKSLFGESSVYPKLHNEHKYFHEE